MVVVRRSNPAARNESVVGPQGSSTEKSPCSSVVPTSATPATREAPGTAIGPPLASTRPASRPTGTATGSSDGFALPGPPSGRAPLEAPPSGAPPSALPEVARVDGGIARACAAVRGAQAAVEQQRRGQQGGEDGGEDSGQDGHGEFTSQMPSYGESVRAWNW